MCDSIRNRLYKVYSQLQYLFGFCFLHQQIISYSVKVLECGFFNRCAERSAGTNAPKVVLGKGKCITNNISTIINSDNTTETNLMLKPYVDLSKDSANTGIKKYQILANGVSSPTA